MNRNQAKEFYPILQAFAEGKEIEGRPKGFSNDFEGWMIIDTISNLDSIEYRIKPESTYRPFANAEECWKEMERHQPFGVVKDKHFANYQTHRAFTFLTTEGCNFRGYEDETFESSFKNLLFADGTPFGVKVEE